MDINSFALGYSAGKKKGGGGAELNIAYGDTPPDDTSKLWVKTEEPSGVIVSTNDNRDSGGESSVEYVSMLPITKKDCGYGAIGDEIYTIFGHTSSDSNPDNYLRKVNIETGGITTGDYLSSISGGISYAYGRGTTVGETIYFFGYFDRSRNAQKYITKLTPTSTNLTKITATLSSARCYVASSAVGHEIYVFGGLYSPKADYPAYDVSDILCFDTTNESITNTGKNLPSAGRWSACTVGSKIYLVKYNTNILYRFDPDGYDIEAVCILPISVGEIASIGEKIMLLNMNQYCFFDVNTNGISAIQEHSDTLWAGNGMLISIGDKFYVSACGQYTDNVNVYNNISSMSLPSEGRVSVQENHLRLITTTGEPTISIINSEKTKVETVVKSAYKGNADGIGDPVEVAIHKDGEWKPI